MSERDLRAAVVLLGNGTATGETERSAATQKNNGKVSSFALLYGSTTRAVWTFLKPRSRVRSLLGALPSSKKQPKKRLCPLRLRHEGGAHDQDGTRRDRTERDAIGRSGTWAGATGGQRGNRVQRSLEPWYDPQWPKTCQSRTFGLRSVIDQCAYGRRTLSRPTCVFCGG